MNIKVVMTVKVGDADYVISDSCKLDGEHEFYADEHASDLVSLMAEKLKSAISPCFFNHDIVAEIKKGETNE